MKRYTTTEILKAMKACDFECQRQAGLGLTPKKAWFAEKVDTDLMFIINKLHNYSLISTRLRTMAFHAYTYGVIKKPTLDYNWRTNWDREACCDAIRATISWRTVCSAINKYMKLKEEECKPSQE